MALAVVGAVKGGGGAEAERVGGRGRWGATLAWAWYFCMTKPETPELRSIPCSLPREYHSDRVVEGLGGWLAAKSGDNDARTGTRISP